MAPRPSNLAVIMAAVDGDLVLLKQMASRIDLRKAEDDMGRNALHAAAANGHLEVCRFLVEETGLDVNSTAPDGGTTPVTQAAFAGKVGVLRYLLDHGGNPAMPNPMGTTPLHYAAQLGHYEAVRLLLAKGVDVDVVDCHQASPLQLAAGNGHDQAVKVLLEHGADPNRVSYNVFSQLLAAFFGGSLKCVMLLVEAGADVNFTTPYAPTALMLAADCGLPDIVRFLLEAGADPNISYEDEDLAGAKPRANKAFAKGDYLVAACFYDMALLKDPLDATLFSNRSLCWLRLGDGKLALLDAQQCKAMCPRWPKAWYREGAALSLLKDYKGAANAFLEALKLDPASDEIKTALREATEALDAACSEEQNS